MQQEVEEYVRSCYSCQTSKNTTRRPFGLLNPIKADYPWQVITMDFVSGFAPGRQTGNTMCLVIVDKFSKYTILESVSVNIDAEQTADVLVKRLISLFGIPEKIITDRGPQFSAQLWHRILNFLGSKSALSAAHHPQTDGQSERAIQTLLQLIRIFANQNQNEWEDLLPMLQFSLNDAFCESTRSTPFRVLFGHDPTSPMSLVSRQSQENLHPDQPITPSE